MKELIGYLNNPGSLFVVLLALIPSVLVIYFFYKNYKVGPISISKILMVLAAGCLTTILVVYPEEILMEFGMERFKSTFLLSFWGAFIVAGFCEELIKFFAIRLVAFNNFLIKNVKDGIFFSITVSVGFAFIENILYIGRYGEWVIELRAIMTVPMHAVATGFMGYYIGKAKLNSNKGERIIYFIKGIIIAIVLHGAFNFFLMYGASLEENGDLNWMMLLSPLIVIVGFYILHSWIKELTDKNNFNENIPREKERKIHPKQTPVYEHPSFIKEVEKLHGKKGIIPRRKVPKKIDTSTEKNKTDDYSYKKGNLYN